MKWIIVLVICVAVASAQRGGFERKHPKQVHNHRGGGRRHQVPEPIVEVVPEIVEEVVVEEIVEPKIELPVEVVEEEPPRERRLNTPKVEVEQPTKPRKENSSEPLEFSNEDKPREHPCNALPCPAGQECVLNKKEEATCVCIKKCPKQKDERAKVCTTSNVTFDSECEMERQKCLCLRRADDCIKPAYRANELDYYGQCKEIKKCTKFEMEQFPDRMRDWLFIVMEELANRNNLNKKSKKLARRADQVKKSNKGLHWSIPALWKFCDLDTSHDDQMTFQELLPMRAPLKGMEHCTESFLDQCAADSKGEITKEGWMKCLNIPEEDEEELKEQFNCHVFEDEE